MVILLKNENIYKFYFLFIFIILFFNLSRGLKMDKEKAKQIIEKFGSPLFVLDKAKLMSQFKKINEAFKSLYPQTIIAYSYKTNYLPYICKTLHDLGCQAEVISGFEYDLARKLGVNGEKIIVNGPYKTKNELVSIIKNGSTINIDNLNELELVNKIAQNLNKTVEVGIRVNAKIGFLPWSKFGFNIGNKEALKIVKLISTKFKNTKLTGIHIHIGTNIVDVSWYEEAIKVILKFIKEIKNNFGVDIKYIDIGGGFASSGACPNNVDLDKWNVPDIKEYAEKICKPLNEFFKSSSKPKLILEPGRYLVDESMYLLTTIVAIKNIFGIKSIFVDAGVNILPSDYYRKHKIKALTYKSPAKELVDLYGPLCMQVDILESGIMLPKVDVGDILMISTTGAYELSHSIQFIRTRPAVVCIDKEKVFLIRRKETLKDITLQDCWEVIEDE
jgi:diaminopimelate decarboxylase